MMKFALADGHWKHAQVFFKLYGWTKRRCRIVRHLCKGAVISGDKGYKLAMKSTIEEVDRCTKRLFKSANGIRDDALAIQRFFHQHKTLTDERG